MNEWVEKLYRLASREQRTIVGLMSGTSLDGLDIALCRISGNGPQTQLTVSRFTTKPYPDAFRTRVREVFAKRTIDQQVLSGLNAWIGQIHGTLVNEALATWDISRDAVDLIASHGQTVFHAPRSLTGNDDYPNSTLQIGDGDHLAVKTGIITVSDFRQKHIATGGEGAPLAIYGDYLLFTDAHETRILLNIGGIANITFLPRPSSGNACFATDVGPGNTLMNQYVQKQKGQEMDEDGRMAASGTVNERLLAALLNHPFFGWPFPKTTGPELFNLAYLSDAQQATGTLDMPENDVMATLCAFTAATIVRAIRQATPPGDVPHVYVSGGGLHNPSLMRHVQSGIPDLQVSTFDQLGLLPDAKEAALFALLANETVAGTATHTKSIGDVPAVCMGKISFPE